MRHLAPILLVLLSGACLVQRPPPDPPAATSKHETRKSFHPGEDVVRSETQLLIWSDGRVERDGAEREYFSDGTLAAERYFAHDQACGQWRTWFHGGTPRSEADFGTHGVTPAPATNRFWHPNGKLAAEGPAIAGVREGQWSYWNDAGVLVREGGYRQGRRDGPWRFYDERGQRRSAGSYALGQRVGEWTLWDEGDVAHVKSAQELGAESSSEVP